jgi:type IV secretory pathway ATPase VirB11/archaellum biosynthesis ATPase
MNMNDAIAKHCGELNRCNQRGGRMLSVFDLLAAKTLDLDLAAYLMARISKGSSFMVGSVPGGAGKTTVMCALLNFVPVDVPLIPATEEAVYKAARAKTLPRGCYVCHEIGSGSYFAYLWAESLREYCGLFEQGHMLATNLHAGNLEQARDQVCGANNVQIDYFNRFDLLIFLRIDDDYFKAHRWIEEVYSSDGSSEHTLVFHAGDN